MTTHVIKLGGSLLNLPDLATRLAQFLDQHTQTQTLIVTGGGSAADTVRHFDQQFKFHTETAHWLAVRAMQFHAHVLCAALPGAALAENPPHCRRLWKQRKRAILKPLPWLAHAQQHGKSLPQNWNFTSDSIAALAAHHLAADQLTLLKSTLPPGNPPTCPARFAADHGIVDPCFPAAAAQLPRVQLINLRTGQTTRLTLNP